MINRTIYVPEVEHCLLCPMQCGMSGVEINKVPEFLTMNPTTFSHSIIVANPTDSVHPHTIPLQFVGVVSIFEYSLPTSAEYKSEEIPHLELTTAILAWDPYNKDFASLKESLLTSGDS